MQSGAHLPQIIPYVVLRGQVPQGHWSPRHPPRPLANLARMVMLEALILSDAALDFIWLELFCPGRF